MGDELNLRLEALNSDHVDEPPAASLHIGGAKDEVRPDIQQLPDAVVEKRGSDQVWMDECVEVSINPAQLAKNLPDGVEKPVELVNRSLTRRPPRLRHPPAQPTVHP